MEHKFELSIECITLLMYTALVACDEQWGIAKDSRVPWRANGVKCPAAALDAQLFVSQIAGRVVIYGAKTLRDMGGCLSTCAMNIIVSQKLTPDKIKDRGAKFAIARDMDHAVQLAERAARNARATCVVLGGAEIYAWFSRAHLISEWHVSRIPGDWKCDLHVLNIAENPAYHLAETRDHGGLCVEIYRYVNHEEQRMLEILRELRAKKEHGGPARQGRAAPCYSVFGRQLRFDLRAGRFPLCTTRRMFFRGIFEELMFVLRGSTNTVELEERGVNVWRANTRRSTLDSQGLQDLPEGDMGHSYGHSMRHFGAQYSTCREDYTGKGFDQLSYCISELRDNPMGRRAIISLWEPNHAHRAALPPCMYQYQFFVEDNGDKIGNNTNTNINAHSPTLSAMVTQRSSDYALAGAWNVASASLFLILLAAHLNYAPGELIWNVGDCHLYANNATEMVDTQLSRAPHSWPRLRVLFRPQKMTEWEFECLELVNYAPHGALNYEMNA